MSLFEAVAVRYIENLIRDFKFKPFQAAAFPGNFGHESGGFEKLQEINPIGGGRGGLGHGQFTGARRVDFENWIARHAMLGWNAGTFEANYSQMFRELTGNAASDESHVVPLLRAAATLDEATDIVCDRFERPNKDYAHKEERRAYARRALAAFEASGIDVTALMAAPRPGANTLEVIEPTKPSTLPGVPTLDINKLLPIMLLMLMGQQKPATPGQPDIMALLLQQMLGGQPIQIPAPATPAPVTPAPSGGLWTSADKNGVGAGTLGLILSGVLQYFGAMGTPFDMGTAPTTTGTIATGASLISMLGGAGGGIGLITSLLPSLLGMFGLAKK